MRRVRTLWRAKRARTPLVLQMEAAECGAAALGMVFGHHRLHVPLERLREECGVSRDGSSAATLIAVARGRGFTAKGLRVKAHALSRVPRPAILHWDQEHFVVLESLDRRHARIIDPSHGRRVLTFEQLERSFTGAALVFEPGPSFRPEGSPPRVLPVLRKWLAGVPGARSLALFIALLGFLLVIPGIVVPAAARHLVDQVLGGGRQELLAPLVIGMAFTAAARSLLTWIQRNALAVLSSRLCADLSRSYLRKALRLPLSFHLARHPADIASRVELSDRLSWLLSSDLPALALAALMAVFFGACLFRLEPDLAIAVLSFAVAAAYCDRAAAASRAERASAALHERSQWAGLTATGILAIETLRANGMEPGFLSRWTAQLRKSARAQASLAWASERNATLTRLLHAIGTTVVLGEGVLRVSRGEMTAGSLVAFQTLMAGFLAPLAEVAGFAAQLDLIRAQIARFNDVLSHPDTAGAAKAPLRARQEDHRAGKLAFAGVSFGYDRFRPPRVTDLSFEIPPGNRVAIVGESGSGKSTIARLAAGLVAPWTGEIRAEGRVAWVEQEIHLFEGTLEENITLWDSSVGRDAIERAVRDACLDGLVDRLPGGLATKLTEGGRNLSGGERQRLEIARALARDPAILILDEATSALDPETEARLHARLRGRRCTVIHIAHRLSSVRECDSILVLSEGRLLERGKHEDLLRAESVYRRLALSEAT